jgi:hypothetical protein
VCGFAVDDTRPVQLENWYPPAAVPDSCTFDPATCHGPAGVVDTVPVPAGATAVVSWYSVCHSHVIVEFCVTVNDTLDPVPLAGTTSPDPPVHPVHTYLTPVAPATGVATEHVTAVPPAYDDTPYAGTGVPACSGWPATVSVYGADRKFAVIETGPVIVMMSGLLIELCPPVQLLNIHPEFGVARICTIVPGWIHGPVGSDDAVPAPPGLVVSVSWYSGIHCHVIVESCCSWNVTDVPVPVSGTSPVPTHPVHTYRVPGGPAAGEFACAVMFAPWPYECWPTAGVGDPYAEFTVR